jgi:hypothetical protein
MDVVFEDEVVLLDKWCHSGTTHEVAHVGASSSRKIIDRCATESLINSLIEGTRAGQPQASNKPQWSYVDTILVRNQLVSSI